jgi:hypothetical protein
MMTEEGKLPMSVSGIVGEEIDKQAALASAALRNGAVVRRLLPRAVFEMLAPYSAALYVAERVVESATFNPELARALHSKLLPLESMVDDVLAAARQRGCFDDADTSEPLHWLETCNEQVKDCMAALESMLDPEIDGLMAAAMEEHQRGETIPLDSIR